MPNKHRLRYPRFRIFYSIFVLGILLSPTATTIQSLVSETPPQTSVSIPKKQTIIPTSNGPQSTMKQDSTRFKITTTEQSGTNPAKDFSWKGVFAFLKWIIGFICFAVIAALAFFVVKYIRKVRNGRYDVAGNKLTKVNAN